MMTSSFTIVLLLAMAATISGQRASTTRYWDCSGGACGCAYQPFGPNSESHCYSNALFAAPSNNPYGAAYYGSAAISETLGGGPWLAEGCGKCWRVTGTSNVGGTPKTTTLVLKGTNFCPPSNPACNGKAHFDIAAPGFDYGPASLSNQCDRLEPKELSGFRSCGYWMIRSSNPNQNCDCSRFFSSVLRKGCENFLALGWNNPDVTYSEVSCPEELTRLPCWEDNGNTYPTSNSGFCADPLFGQPAPEAVPVAAPVAQPAPRLVPVPVPFPQPVPAPAPQPVPAPAPQTVPAPSPNGFNPYCSWENCNGKVQGGPWCNESEARCIACGGNSRWCTGTEPIDPPVNGYCSWENCNGVVQGGDWCNESESRCISCGGGSKWCPF